MRNLATVTALLLLSACGWDHEMNAGLDRFLGQPAHHALNRLGRVDDERWVANEKLYAWGERRTVRGEQTLSGASGVTPPQNIDANETAAEAARALDWGCYIRLFVDANGMIQRYDWTGNQLDCRPFIERLKRWPE